MLHTPINRSAWFRYGAAVVASGGALALKLLLVPLVTQDAPFLLFFVAVMLAAWIGGLGPGLLATALATLFNNYFFMQPFGQFMLGSPDQQFRMALFGLEGIFISLICARLLAARKHAEDSALEARQLERRILEISDAEQRRIGHDLHDGLGQHLTGIALMSRRLEQRLGAAQSPFTAEAADVSLLAKTAVGWTHDLCRSLSPPVLEREGLPEALRELAANAENIFRIECQFIQNGDFIFRDVDVGMHLYRIAQEAISNAVKHGKAKHVRIFLSLEAGEMTMRVCDDGMGLTEGAVSGDGMGLQIMRYRATMIGAEIDVTPQASGGTVVTCRYAQPAAAQQNLDVPNAPH